jgi:hypothetical protein
MRQMNRSESDGRNQSQLLLDLDDGTQSTPFSRCKTAGNFLPAWQAGAIRCRSVAMHSLKNRFTFEFA